MSTRNLTLVLVVLIALIGLDAIGRRPAPAAPPAPQVTPEAPVAVAPPAASTPQSATFAATTDASPSAAMEAVNLMARLAIRRRLEREGNRVYLDSMLVSTDSVLVRWVDRENRPITIGLFPDSTLAGWRDDLQDEIRAVMQVWNGNEGVRLLLVTPADSADIQVRWTATLSDSGELGSTNVNWGQDGAITRSVITLALRDNTGNALVVPATRRRVIAHELGHALGLPHSSDRDDLMFPSSLVPTPSRRDQGTLVLLYALPAGPLRTP